MLYRANWFYCTCEKPLPLNNFSPPQVVIDYSSTRLSGTPFLQVLKLAIGMGILQAVTQGTPEKE